MMRNLIISYTGIYILLVLVAALYSYFKTKKMSLLRLLLTLMFDGVVLTCLVFYSRGYNPLQMVGFALAFTSISTLFLYNGLKGENNHSLVILGLSFGRLLIHIQLLLFLYIFR